MADVAAQSIEEFGDRIIYRYPAARFEQVPVIFSAALSPGLKTLVNTQAAVSFVIPPIGITAKLFQIDWLLKTYIVLQNDALAGTPLTCVNIGFVRMVTPSPLLNYDGKSLQTQFYETKTTNLLSSKQLRSINVSDIQLEPASDSSNYANGPASDARFLFNTPSAVSYLLALFQPVVTLYKK